MENGNVFSISTEQIDCDNVHILNVTNESILISDPEGRRLELDLDAIIRFECVC